MRSRRAATGAAALALLLGGCAGANVNNDLKAFVGRNVQTVIVRLGEPSLRRAGAGGMVYVWTSTSQVRTATAGPVLLSGGAGNGGTSGGGMPSGAVIPGEVSVTLTCAVQFSTDAEGKIIGYRSSGNAQSCARIATALSRTGLGDCDSAMPGCG